MSRNGLRIKKTLNSITDVEKFYYKKPEALDFVLNTNLGISLANYDHHYKMGFELTSTQEASYYFFLAEFGADSFVASAKLSDRH